MEENKIEMRTAKIWLGDDGIIRVIYQPGSEVVFSDAEEAVVAVAKILGGRKAPILANISGVKSTTRDARSHFGGEESSKNMLALALVVGSPISKVIGNFFLGLNKPGCPTRLFTSESEALDWLREFTK